MCFGLLVASCSTFSVSSGEEADDQATTTLNEADDATDAADEGPATTQTSPELPDPLWEQLQLELVPIAQLEQPIAFSSRSGSLNYYVAERAGRVRVIERTISDTGRERISLSGRAMLDITEMVGTRGEGGLLGLTFSTDGRLLYVSYTDHDGSSVIAEYLVNRDQRADVESRRELLRVEQPFSNHNGGNITLGEDGFLYIALGDGGGSGDPEGAGQNLETLLGKILRIDAFPDGEQPYSIPDGNPFAQGGGREEIWLWGVRNPWRFSFDENGDLWIADVGQDRVEEVNLLPASTGGGRGANLGWNLVEGNQSFEGADIPDDHTSPIFTYEQSERCSVTGGAVYRGELMALLQGVYLFGDYCSGEIFGLEVQPEGVVVRPLTIEAAGGQLVSFGQAADGELFVLEIGGSDDLGTVYRIEPAESDGGG